MANSRLKDCNVLWARSIWHWASRKAKYINLFAAPTLVKWPRARTARLTVAFKLSIASSYRSPGGSAVKTRRLEPLTSISAVRNVPRPDTAAPVRCVQIHPATPPLDRHYQLDKSVSARQPSACVSERSRYTSYGVLNARYRSAPSSWEMPSLVPFKPSTASINTSCTPRILRWFKTLSQNFAPSCSPSQRPNTDL